MSPCLRVVALLACVSPLFTLVGCAGAGKNTADITRPDARIRDRLATQITDDGLKLFTYTVTTDSPMTANPDVPIRSRRLEADSQRSNAQRQGRGLPQRVELDLTEWTEQIELGLSRTLEMSGYCREGSIEISRFIEAERAEIRGECHEGANDADLRRFGKGS